MRFLLDIDESLLEDLQKDGFKIEIFTEKLTLEIGDVYKETETGDKYAFITLDTLEELMALENSLSDDLQITYRFLPHNNNKCPMPAICVEW